MRRCPKCITPLTRVEDSGINLQTCGGCMGHWIDHMRLVRLVRLPLSAEAANQPLEQLPALVSEADSKNILRCPECSVDMG